MGYSKVRLLVGDPVERSRPPVDHYAALRYLLHSGYASAQPAAQGKYGSTVEGSFFVCTNVSFA